MNRRQFRAPAPVSGWLALPSVCLVPGLLQGWLAFAPVWAGFAAVSAGATAVFCKTCKFEPAAGFAGFRFSQPSTALGT